MREFSNLFSRVGHKMDFLVDKNLFVPLDYDWTREDVVLYHYTSDIFYFLKF